MLRKTNGWELHDDGGPEWWVHCPHVEAFLRRKNFQFKLVESLLRDLPWEQTVKQNSARAGVNQLDEEHRQYLAFLMSTQTHPFAAPVTRTLPGGSIGLAEFHRLSACPLATPPWNRVMRYDVVCPDDFRWQHEIINVLNTLRTAKPQTREESLSNALTYYNQCKDRGAPKSLKTIALAANLDLDIFTEHAQAGETMLLAEEALKDDPHLLNDIRSFAKDVWAAMRSLVDDKVIFPAVVRLQLRYALSAKELRPIVRRIAEQKTGTGKLKMFDQEEKKLKRERTVTVAATKFAPRTQPGSKKRRAGLARIKSKSDRCYLQLYKVLDTAAQLLPPYGEPEVLRKATTQQLHVLVDKLQEISRAGYPLRRALSRQKVG